MYDFAVKLKKHRLLNVPIRFEEIVIVIICLFISAEWS